MSSVGTRTEASCGPARSGRPPPETTAATGTRAADTAASVAPDPPAFEREITLTAGDLELAAHLAIPDRATGAVIFALGSGSSRRSPRDRLVAAKLNQAGLGTLLADLLTPEEALRRVNVFDVRLLAARLTGITRWLRRHPAARGIPLGYFGASTGAAAALWAAAADPPPRRAPARTAHRNG